MSKFLLLPQRRTGQRMRWKLLLLAIILLSLGLYDQFSGILGPNWIWIWVALLAVVVMWLYYALLIPRAAVHITPAYIRLQGPIYGRKLSFERIVSISPGKLDQHYPYKSLGLGERPILKPLYHRTCTFIEMNSYPKAFKWRRWWFPRTLFGTRKPGLLCHVKDWMAFSQELESARARRHALRGAAGARRQMTLAGRILAEDVEFS